MADDQNEELLALVKSLSDRVNTLEGEIKTIKLINAQNVPEETLIAIAAAVSGYMGFRAKRRQAHFTTSRTWQATTRRSQLSHSPLHLR